MKRNTPEHWKTEMLMETLSIGLAQAVGHLELLFNTTAKHTPHGDIGKMPNSIIAKRCGWVENADKFVQALIKCRWLDECTVNRLTVHDWEEHCDDSTRKQVNRSKTPFKVAVRTTADIVRTCPDNGGQSLPTMPNQALPSQALPSLTTDEKIAPKTDSLDASGIASSHWFRIPGTYKQPIEEWALHFETKLSWYKSQGKDLASKVMEYVNSKNRDPTKATTIAQMWKFWQDFEETYSLGDFNARRDGKHQRDPSKSAGGGRYEGIKPKINGLL